MKPKTEPKKRKAAAPSCTLPGGETLTPCSWCGCEEVVRTKPQALTFDITGAPGAWRVCTHKPVCHTDGCANLAKVRVWLYDYCQECAGVVLEGAARMAEARREAGLELSYMDEKVLANAPYVAREEGYSRWVYPVRDS